MEIEKKLNEIQQTSRTIERILSGHERFVKRIHAARILDCDPKTLDKMVQEGKINVYDVGGLRRFKYSELLQLGQTT